jgi:Ca2+-binding EF-hand superfamily protein
MCGCFLLARHYPWDVDKTFAAMDKNKKLFIPIDDMFEVLELVGNRPFYVGN